MGGQSSKAFTWNRVLIDVCTQRDFLEAGAILQVANRETLLGNLQRIFNWSVSTGVPVVSTIESHRPTEPLNSFPLHCIDGTEGQKKVPFTLLEPRILIEADNFLSLPPDLGAKYHQLIFRKRAREILSNPKTDRLLTQLHSCEFIILGVGLERAIKSLGLGLLARHKTVSVVSDACGYWSAADADLALRQLSAKGVKLMTTDELIAPPPLPKAGRRKSRRSGTTPRRHHPGASASQGSTRTRLSPG